MTDWLNDIHQGDAAETLATLPESSVHMCMTSPPYWNLRDYGAEGQLGLEDSADQYVQNISDVMDEVKRVLRPDGSLWLNLGDTYDDKDKQLIPQRVALELKERGWTLRNDVTWVKPNPMPASVKDRLNTTTEQIFHLTPNPDYWYDLDAIREEHAKATKERDKYGSRTNDEWVKGQEDNHNASGHSGMNPAGKNPGDVFEVTTKPFPDAHFAVYPPDLCEKPIKATCPPKVCVECGTPYERDVETSGLGGEAKIQTDGNRDAADEREVSETSLLRTNGRTWRKREHKGWNQLCDCDTDDTQPGIALDPFAGAGTTLLKAKDLGRRFVGIELNPEYVAMAQKRVGVTVDDPDLLLDDEETTLRTFGGDADD